MLLQVKIYLRPHVRCDCCRRVIGEKLQCLHDEVVTESIYGACQGRHRENGLQDGKTVVRYDNETRTQESKRLTT